jgi:CheY-like chemotaxis protein
MPESAAPKRLGGVTLLVVEDDRQVRESTVAWLERLGCKTLAAANDEAAQWLWKRHRHQIDILLTDLMIPSRATGVDLARQFGQDKPELTVILMSGFGRDMVVDDPEFPTGWPYLQKPFTPAELEAVLQAVLHR